MAELEIHHESEGEHDPRGQQVGVLAAVLAVLLAIVTILSHRAHTEGVLLKTEANDTWAFYQAKRIKLQPGTGRATDFTARREECRERSGHREISSRTVSL